MLGHSKESTNTRSILIPREKGLQETCNCPKFFLIRGSR